MVSKEEFEELRAKLATYEAQQKESQAQIKEEVREQVGEVAVARRELYAQASSAVGKFDTRVEKLEAKGGWWTKIIVALQKYDNQCIGEDGSMEKLEVGH